MDAWTVLGLLAGLVTSAGFVPQIVKGVRTKHMGDVSLWMPIVLAAGMGMWLVYGIHMRDVAIIVANVIAVAFNLIIILLKLKYSGKR